MTFQEFIKMVKDLDCLEFVKAPDFSILDSAKIVNTDITVLWTKDKIRWFICSEQLGSNTPIDFEEVLEILDSDVASPLFYYLNHLK